MSVQGRLNENRTTTPEPPSDPSDPTCPGEECSNNGGKQRPPGGGPSLPQTGANGMNLSLLMGASILAISGIGGHLKVLSNKNESDSTKIGKK